MFFSIFWWVEPRIFSRKPGSRGGNRASGIVRNHVGCHNEQKVAMRAKRLQTQGLFVIFSWEGPRSFFSISLSVSRPSDSVKVAGSSTISLCPQLQPTFLSSQLFLGFCLRFDLSTPDLSLGDGWCGESSTWWSSAALILKGFSSTTGLHGSTNL